MKKKGILSLFAVYALATVFSMPAAAVSASAQADRTPEGLVPNFSEDFESYETEKWIEDTDGFALKWSNNVLDDGEELGMDSHLRERAKIIYDEGTNNKVLHLDNRYGGNSFFYIGPKGDYRYKNFSISFRVKFIESGWVSAVVRKDANVWYNGCNNINATFFVASDDSCLSLVPYRNMPGAADQQLNPNATLDLEGYTLSQTNYTNGSQSYLNQWFNVRYEINEKSYKMYVNDTLMMDLFYPSKKLLDFGYVSLNACTANVYFDDVEIENWDTEAPPALEVDPPVEESSSTNSASSSTQTSTEDKKSGGCGSTAASTVALTLFTAGAVVCGKKRRKVK